MIRTMATGADTLYAETTTGRETGFGSASCHGGAETDCLIVAPKTTGWPGY